MNHFSAAKTYDLKPNYIHFLLFFILFFTNQMDFRNSEVILGARIDLQVFIRLGVLGVFTLAALWYWQRFIELCRQLPLFLYLFYLTYLTCVSANIEVITFYSFYALSTHIAMCLIIVVMTDRFGTNNIIYYYFLGTTIFCLISLLYYYFLPDIGRYTYWQNDILYQSTRLKGIGGHPNTLGFMAASGLIAALHTYAVRYPVSKLVYFFALILLYSLILTNSRSSLGFLIITLIVYFFIHSRSVILSTPFISIFAITFIFGYEFFKEQILAMLGIFSRSGSTEEITSVTGRSSIWEVVMNLIQERPVFGWGHANLEAILFQKIDEVGFAVGQAHNFYLQAAFAGGLLGLSILMVCMVSILVIACLRAYRQQFAFDFCAMLYIMLAGLTESIMLATVSGNNYLVFMLVVVSTTLYCEQTQRNKKETLVIETHPSPHQQ